MIHYRAIFIATSMLCVLPVMARAADGPLALVEHEFIVDARVIGSRPDGVDGAVCTLEVTGVRAAPVNLQGMTFVVESGIAGRDRPPRGALWPPLEVGERGVWPVFRLNDGSLGTGNWGSRLPRWLPLRPRLSDRAEDDERAVWQVATVLTAPRGERRAMLKKLAATSESEVAGWAATLLTEVASHAVRDDKPDGLREELRELFASTKTSAAARLVIDEHLDGVEPAFAVSPERSKVWAEIAAGKLTRADFAELRSRVARNRWSDAADQLLLERTAIALADNVSVDLDDRAWVLAFTAGTLQPRSRGVACVLAVAKRSRHWAMRVRAARVIEGMHEIDDESKGVIRQASADIKDVDAVATLHRVLRRQPAKHDGGR